MKKISVGLLSVLLIFIISGCSLMGFSVDSLKGWTFQYNEGTNDYSLFFGLWDSSENYISADGNIDIRIEDESGNILYQKTKSFSSRDFGTYSSEATGERYLADIRIPKNDVEKGSSTSGKVYLKVYNEDAFEFDEVNCEALYCLPVKDIEMKCNLPVVVDTYTYTGTVESKLNIEEVSVKFDELVSWTTITVKGTKLEGKSSSYDNVNYKIYDLEGFVIDSGSMMLSSLTSGDKFKEEITSYDLVPGEKYNITFESETYDYPDYEDYEFDF